MVYKSDTNATTRFTLAVASGYDYYFTESIIPFCIYSIPALIEAWYTVASSPGSLFSL